MRFSVLIRFISVVFCSAACLLPSASWGQDYEVQELIDKSKDRMESYELEELKTNDTLLEEARRRVEGIDLPEVEQGRVGDIFGYDFEERLAAEREKNVTGEKLYVFVSFSMKDSLIREYIQDAARVGGVVVIGGLHNGSFKETVQKVSTFTKVSDGEHRGGVAIDPKAFETFGVAAVPTIVLAKNELSKCLSADCVREVPDHDRMLGSVKLSYALEQFAREGDMRGEAEALLRIISKDIYSAYRE